MNPHLYLRRGGRSEWAELTLFRPDTPKKRGLEYSDENDNLSKKFFCGHITIDKCPQISHQQYYIFQIINILLNRYFFLKLEYIIELIFLPKKYVEYLNELIFS